MIVVLVSDLNYGPLKRLIHTAKGHLPQIKLVTYTQAFFRQTVPAAPIVFTDFDLLNAFELDVAGAIAVNASKRRNPVEVLNHPARVLERFTLLHSLHASGLNDVQVTRLELGARPEKYPVFIRLEDGCLRPDTGPLSNEAEFDAALLELESRGLAMRHRIAVSLESEISPDGYYRKYGAFRIGDRIIPHHILRAPDWVVKSNRAHVDPAFAEEELNYIETNPHEAELHRFFDHANIQFGRIDYTLRHGRIVVFEINTNPSFPRFKGGNPARQKRRSIILESLKSAFEAIDAPVGDEPVDFSVEKDLSFYLKRKRWNWFELRSFSATRRKRLAQLGETE